MALSVLTATKIITVLFVYAQCFKILENQNGKVDIRENVGGKLDLEHQ
jgi:hypothetical protein